MTEEDKAKYEHDELMQLIKQMTPKQIDEYLELEEQKRVLKARDNYIDYLRLVYPDWKDGKHILFLCEKIEKFLNNELLDEKGRVARFLLLSMPPQHGKSMTVTDALPSWLVGKTKNTRVALVSYGEDLANEFGRENLLKIHEYGKMVFDVELNPTAKAVGDFRLNGHRGRIFSRGIQAGITGNAADLIIIDDPLKGEKDSSSEDARNYINKEFKKSIVSRLSANAKVIIIQTRWHEDDLIGRIVKENKLRYVYYNIPCEAEEEDILDREKGEALFPEIGKDKEWLKEFKEIYSDEEGQRAWLSLYQGKPVVDGGDIIHYDWIQKYKSSELPKMGKTIISVDATFKDKITSDFVSIGVWGKVNNKYYLLDEVHERLNFPATMQAIRRMKTRYPQVSNVLIEDKANGSSIIQMMKEEIDGITPVEPQGGKVARLNAVSHLFESGQVYLPSDKEWFAEFVDELAKFPNGKHDDRCDMTSQALSRLMKANARLLTEQEKEREELNQYKYLRKVQTLAGGNRASRAYIKFH